MDKTGLRLVAFDRASVSGGTLQEVLKRAEIIYQFLTKKH